MLVDAARDGNLDLVVQLLDAGVKPDAGHFTGYTALGLAVNRGHESVVRALLERNADPDQSISSGDDVAPLMIAVVWNRLEMVSLLLRHGCSLEKRATGGSHRGRTALDVARERLHRKPMRLLQNVPQRSPCP